MRQSQGAASPGGAASSHPVRPPKALEVAGQACSWAPPYLPEHEADRVHHCGLDDLSPREDAPRDGVGLQLGGVGDVVTLRGGGAVGRGRLRVVVETVVVVVALVVVGRVLGALVTGGVFTVMTPLSPESRPGGLPGASGQVGGRGGALLVVLEGGRGVCFPGVDGWSLGLGAEGWPGPLVPDLSGGVGIPGPR